MSQVRIDPRRLAAIAVLGLAATVAWFAMMVMVSLGREYDLSVGDMLPIAAIGALLAALIAYGGWRLWHHR